MKIGVMGAGAIGCYVGGRLAAAGVDVSFVGRASLAAEVARHGLRLTDYRGADLAVRAPSFASAPEALADRDVVLVTVKGGDTAAVGAALAPVLRDGARVVSFQNGVNNPAVLRAALPGRRVLAGMVPFNVVRREGGHFHQGTSGTLAVERADSDDLVAALRAAGLPTEQHDDMRGVLWGKLLVNLNNSVNALANIPIKEMLGQRDYRRVMAACMREGLAAVEKAGIRPVVDVPVPARAVPWLLTLPDALFSVVARRLLTVDPQARSSMWDDLQRGRKTEVDALNGEIVRLAAEVGTPAPVNAAIVALVHAAEGRGSPGLSGAALRARLLV
jgi:2-dehydropantoate 2-reductase